MMIVRMLTILLATAVVGGVLAATQHFYAPAFPWVLGFMLCCLAKRVLEAEQ
jgi:hypothetical protein